MAPVLQVISQVVFLHMKFGGFLYILFLKIRQMNYYCSAYTVQCTQKPHGVTLRNHTSPHTKSHQLRTMNVRGYNNSIPWMNLVTSTPYHEWTQSYQLCTMNARSFRLRQVTFIQFNQKIFRTNCVHSWYGVGVTVFIHGTELMQFGKWPHGVQKSP